MMTMSFAEQDLETFDFRAVPPEAALVMSALDAAGQSMVERRVIPRKSYRTITLLRLFRDQPDSAGWRLYTRDINRRGMGFVTPHRLPLGYGGMVMLPNQHGKVAAVHCTLSRCREASPGWFEGCLHFNREQPQFDT